MKRVKRINVKFDHLFALSFVLLITSCGDDNNAVRPRDAVDANFESNVTIASNQATLTLINTSKNATTYQWFFPNGTPESSTEATPKVVYTRNGAYSITLTSSNRDQSSTKTI